MQKSNEPLPVPAVYPAAQPTKHWTVELDELLAQAAELCVRNGVDADSFMRSAWSAYIDARPGLREHLEEMQLRSQLEELRKLGRVGEA